MTRVRGSRKFLFAVFGALALVGLTAESAWAATPGAVVWSQRYDGGSHGDDAAVSTAVIPDGKIAVVTGYATKNGKTDVATVGYDPSNGSRKWATLYNGPTNGNDVGRAVAASPGNDVVVVTGRSDDGTTPTITTIGYDAHTGKQKWVNRFRGSAGADPSSLAISPDNSFVAVTGTALGATPDDHADVTLAYDLHTGSQLWVHTNSTLKQKEATRSVAITPDSSRVLVAGDITSKAIGLNFFVMELNASNGVKKWIKRTSTVGAHDDSATAVTVSKDGATVFVAGKAGSDAGVDAMVVAYDTVTGKPKWNQRYNGGGNDIVRAITMTGDGASVVIGGQSQGTGTNDALTVAFDAATGTQAWVARETGTSADADGVNGVVATPDGNAVVSAGVIGNAALIVSYDAHTGVQRWIKLYQRTVTSPSGPVSLVTSAAAVALTPSGATAVATGQSQSTTTHSDIETVAIAV